MLTALYLVQSLHKRSLDDEAKIVVSKFLIGDFETFAAGFLVFAHFDFTIAFLG